MSKYKTIKYNDRFEFTRDKYQWILTEWKDGVSRKTKKPIRAKRTTYHGNIEQICNTIIDRSLDACEDLQELMDHLKRTRSQLKARLDEEAESV